MVYGARKKPRWIDFSRMLKSGRVSIRVGTPPQWVNVFVSTASEETWVVGPGGGCTGSMSFRFPYQSACSNKSSDQTAPIKRRA